MSRSCVKFVKRQLQGRVEVVAPRWRLHVERLHDKPCSQPHKHSHLCVEDHEDKANALVPLGVRVKQVELVTQRGEDHVQHARSQPDGCGKQELCGGWW